MNAQQSRIQDLLVRAAKEFVRLDGQVTVNVLNDLADEGYLLDNLEDDIAVVLATH